MKSALRRVLAGESYRLAAEAEAEAEAEGVGWRDVHRNAGTISGLREAHIETWHADWGEKFPPLWRHHLRGESEHGGEGKGAD